MKKKAIDKRRLNLVLIGDLDLPVCPLCGCRYCQPLKGGWFACMKCGHVFKPKKKEGK